MAPSKDRDISDVLDRISFHMGQQTEFQKNANGWMEKLDKKIDELPANCHTGKGHEARLQELEHQYSEPKYYDPTTKMRRSLIWGGAGLAGGSGIAALIWQIISELLQQ